MESKFGCAWKRGEGGLEGETPTELLLYINIYFRQSYPAGDGRFEAELMRVNRAWSEQSMLR